MTLEFYGDVWKENRWQVSTLTTSTIHYNVIKVHILLVFNAAYVILNDTIPGLDYAVALGLDAYMKMKTRFGFSSTSS